MPPVLDREQEERWEEERVAALFRFVAREADRIAAIPSLEDRRRALEEWVKGKPARIRERLEVRLTEIWAWRHAGEETGG